MCFLISLCVSKKSQIFFSFLVWLRLSFFQNLAWLLFTCWDWENAKIAAVFRCLRELNPPCCHAAVTQRCEIRSLKTHSEPRGSPLLPCDIAIGIRSCRWPSSSLPVACASERSISFSQTLSTPPFPATVTARKILSALPLFHCHQGTGPLFPAAALTPAVPVCRTARVSPLATINAIPPRISCRENSQKATRHNAKSL